MVGSPRTAPSPQPTPAPHRWRWRRGLRCKTAALEYRAERQCRCLQAAPNLARLRRTAWPTEGLPALNLGCRFAGCVRRVMRRCSNAGQVQSTQTGVVLLAATALATSPTALTIARPVLLQADLAWRVGSGQAAPLEMTHLSRPASSTRASLQPAPGRGHARRSSAAPRRLDHSDVDFGHFHHRVEGALGSGLIRIGDRVHQGARGDLP